MNTEQLTFAYKVRHALNENLDHLPPATLERLASARKIALSAKKQEAPKRAYATQGKFAAYVGGYFNEPFSWIGRLGMALPVIALVSGLIMIYQVERQQHISDLAEIETLVLSDELPLSAYLDHGFNAYLANLEE
jgi:hypothetical protein